jgi:sulfatase maturation enzyme AslB (radical SAM superfamily)
MKHNKFGHIDIPLKRIHIELTNVCDFNCIFCPKPVMTRPLGYMDTGLAKDIISEVGKYGLAEKVTFHVMGEPTLHRDFFDILDHAASENVPVGLTTNGGGLGGPVGEKLLDYPLHQIDVSLQTPDKDSFDMRRSGRLSFDHYLGSALNFFAEYRRRHRESIVKFRFLNTALPCKSMEKKVGPVRVMSSTKELRSVFAQWVERVYRLMGVNDIDLDRALRGVNKLVSYKWNVVEVLPNLFFETYILGDWGHAFYDGPVRKAWAGYCFGMRDHFAVLQNGDVTLCCIDFDGKTAIGNLHNHTLKDILSGDEVGSIIRGFKRFKLEHPHCKICLGGKNYFSWLTKPVQTILFLKLLKPCFYNKSRLMDDGGLPDQLSR